MTKEQSNVKKGLNLLTKRAQYKKANLVVGAGGGGGYHSVWVVMVLLSSNSFSPQFWSNQWT